MKIASLVPSATEMLFAIGLGDDVVAVTHECDFPPRAASLPHLTSTVIPEGLSAGEVDAEVKRVVGEGRALYELDEGILAELEPDLIVTQAVCDVCAVSFEDVSEVAARLPGRPEVLSQDPRTLSDVLDDLARLGEVARAGDAAHAASKDLRRRLDHVRDSVAGAERPRVLALEWLDPPFAGGHWVPEMIEIAGGIDVLGRVGEKSREVQWEELLAARPEVVVAMPCGYYADDSLLQVEDHRDRIDSLGASALHAVDAASAFSRPGPRLVDGVELLAHLLHPESALPPAGVAHLTPASA